MSAWLIIGSAPPSSAALARQRSAVQRGALPCPAVRGGTLCDAVRCCAVLRRAVRAVPCCAVLSVLLH